MLIILRRTLAAAAALAAALILIAPSFAASYTVPVTIYSGSQPDEQDGSMVAMNGSLLIVGEAGWKYGVWLWAFQPNSSTTFAQRSISASDNGVVGDFGVSGAISGSTIVIGDDQNNGNIGAAYVFTHTEPTQTSSQQAKLVYPDTGANSRFGYAVSVSGDTLAVGAYAVNKVYIYTRSGTVWTLQQTLDPGGSASTAARTGRPAGASPSREVNSPELDSYSWEPRIS